MAIADLIVVPKQFFTPEVIERRKPLAATARRPGWVGCNILLGEVLDAGKVRLIREGVFTPKAEVIAKFRETLFLRRAGAGARGWLIEVLKWAEAAAAGEGAFTLDAVYGFEGRLAALYPENNNVRPKIRRRLQVLRDAGLVAFLGAGGIGWCGGRREAVPPPASRRRRARARQGALRSSLRSPLTRPARGGRFGGVGTRGVP